MNKINSHVKSKNAIFTTHENIIPNPHYCLLICTPMYIYRFKLIYEYLRTNYIFIIYQYSTSNELQCNFK